MQTVSINNPPSCFGKQWEKHAPECAGGPDVTFTDPRTGSHIRERCEYYGQCGVRMQAQNLVPAQSLVRPPLVTPPPAPSVSPLVQQQMAAQLQQQAQLTQQMAQRAMQQVPVAVPPPVPQNAPLHAVPVPQPMAAPPPQQYYPAQQYQLNYMMPPYLTVPEQRPPDGSVWGVLGREMVRAAGKSLGHTIAHFFDVNPFRRRQ